MRILLAGARGMLGSAFATALGDDVVAPGRDELDVRDVRALYGLVEGAGVDAVVNCAANVDAEAAEVDVEPAVAANVLLPGLLATACRRACVPLVHFSSTGCYGSWKTEAYVEEDPLRPTTAHHQTKLAGEAAVRDAGCEHLILRTGWLFGGGPEHAKNFVWRRLLDAVRAERLDSDVGQRGCPTWTDDVVRQTMRLFECGLRGTFNCVGGGEATRYAYVEAIVRAAGLDVTLVPTGPFQRRAAVSPNETARNRRLALLGLDVMPDWRESLERYVGEVTRWPEWAALKGTTRD